MAVLTPSRPDLLAYREATTLGFPKLVERAIEDHREKIDGVHCFCKRHPSD